MMAEKWIRKPLPCEPGYNNCAEEVLSFTTSYDSVNDRLIITATMPVFGAIDSITFEGTGGNGTTTSLSIQSGTVVWITNAFAELLGPTTISQLDFFNAGPLLIGTWTGSVDIAGPLTIVSGTTMSWLDGQNFPSGIGTIGTCPEILTQVPTVCLGVGLSSPNPDFDGVEVVYSDASTQQFDTASSNVFEFAPGNWIVADAALANKEIATVTGINAANAPITPAYALPADRNAVRTITSVTVDATQVEIVVAPMVIGVSPDFFGPGVDSVLSLTGCAENGGDFVNKDIYSPLGPNAGLNIGFTVNQWDAAGIQVDTTEFTPPEDVDGLMLAFNGGAIILLANYP